MSFKRRSHSDICRIDKWNEIHKERKTSQRIFRAARQSKMFWFVSTCVWEQRRQQYGITQKRCDYLTGPPAGMGQGGKSHGQLRACGRHCLIAASSGMSSSACTTSSALQQHWKVPKLQHRLTRTRQQIHKSDLKIEDQDHKGTTEERNLSDSVINYRWRSFW